MLGSPLLLALLDGSDELLEVDVRGAERGGQVLAQPVPSWYAFTGCGIWFNSFSFLVPRPRSNGTMGLAVELGRHWPGTELVTLMNL